MLPGTPVPDRAPLSWLISGLLPSQLFPGVLKHSWGANHGKGEKKRNLFSLGKVASGQPGTGIVILDHLCTVSLAGNYFSKARMLFMSILSIPGHWLFQQVHPSNSCHCVGVRECVLGCHW